MSEGNRKTGRFQAVAVWGVTSQHSAVVTRSDDADSRLYTVDNVKIGRFSFVEALHSALRTEV